MISDDDKPLTEEYAELCRRLTEKLARKCPSPLVSGSPNTWACGIVRTVGSVAVHYNAVLESIG